MTLDPRVDIGHVHLKVADLERAIASCRDVPGLDLAPRGTNATRARVGRSHASGSLPCREAIRELPAAHFPTLNVVTVESGRDPARRRMCEHRARTERSLNSASA